MRFLPDKNTRISFLFVVYVIITVILMTEDTDKNITESQEKVEETAQVKETVNETTEDAELEHDESLPFPNATVVREIKKHITGNKMVKKEVKIAMNRFLRDIVRDVSEKMNDYPYAIVDYRMFEESIRPYKLVKEMDREKERLVHHLDVIVQDCLSIKRDLDNKFESSEL